MRNFFILRKRSFPYCTPSPFRGEGRVRGGLFYGYTPIPFLAQSSQTTGKKAPSPCERDRGEVRCASSRKSCYSFLAVCLKSRLHVVMSSARRGMAFFFLHTFFLAKQEKSMGQAASALGREEPLFKEEKSPFFKSKIDRKSVV